jgi:hypothetical protein
VPDSFVGKEVQCPKCRRLLVPLTPEKMENYAAKVLFAAQADPRQARGEEIIREEAAGPEIPFACPFCGEAYQVSEDLAGKKITCRNCREPCKVDSPKTTKKTRRNRSKFSWQMVWLGALLALVFILIGFLMGRVSRS